MANEVTIYVPKHMQLPDNDQWQNRFYVKSSSSDNKWTVAQHKTKKHWACSCPGWKRHRKCQHLSSVGVPNYEVPFEAQIR